MLLSVPPPRLMSREKSILLMIAPNTSVCYSEDMKKLGSLMGLFGVVGVTIYFFGNELLLFVLAGRVPFINVVIPPVAMFLFWLLIVPISIILWRIFNLSTWKILESIAAAHQRYLNRRVRLFTPPLSPQTISLITAALLAIETENRQSPAPTSAMRRRLAPLPI